MLTSALLLLCSTLPPAARAIDAAHDAGVFDGEVLIAIAGTVAHEQAVGFQNREQAQRHVIGSSWRWASVTKQVVAVLVMQEVEKGSIALDSTLDMVLPRFEGPTKNKITVRMLLQHTSGLPNPDATTPSRDGGLPSFYEKSSAAPAFGLCAGPSASSEVGSAFSYNNCDFLVLGAILERVTKKPWSKLVAERIAGPLGLKSLTAAKPASKIIGYDEFGTREPSFVLESFGPAGALSGTARDLFRFDEGLRLGALLKPESMKVLWAGDPKLGFEALGQWSYTVTTPCAGPVDIVERRGAIGAMQVLNLIVPGRAVDIVLFSNNAKTEWGEVWAGRGLGHELLVSAVCQTK